MAMKYAAIALVVCSVTACSKSEAPKESEAQESEASPAAGDPHAGLSSYGVDQVESLLAKKQVVPVDANSADTREEFGTLPGAVLLTSSREFELSELPKDKSQDLVFYCGSEKCRAAPRAAKRAQAAGYEKVHVMPAGIRGWVKAGKRVENNS